MEGLDLRITIEVVTDSGDTIDDDQIVYQIRHYKLDNGEELGEILHASIENLIGD